MKGAWFRLNFHNTVKTSLLFIVVLFTVFVFGCFRLVLGLCVKLDEILVWLVMLVVVVAAMCIFMT